MATATMQIIGSAPTASPVEGPLIIKTDVIAAPARKRGKAAAATDTAKVDGSEVKESPPKRQRRAPVKKAVKEPAVKKTPAPKKAPAPKKTPAGKKEPAPKKAPVTKKAPAPKKASVAKKAPAPKKAAAPKKASPVKAVTKEGVKPRGRPRKLVDGAAPEKPKPRVRKNAPKEQAAASSDAEISPVAEAGIAENSEPST